MTNRNNEGRAPEMREAIRRMNPYEWEPPSARIAKQAGVPEDQVVRFDTNTFPWAGATLEDLPPLALNEYPDTSYGDLTEAISQYADVPPEQITVGAGADEILDMCAKAYIEPGDPICLSRPTYPMFRILSEMAGGNVEDIPSVDLQLDRKAFLAKASQARVTWICNANNPTGELLPLEFIAEVARSTGGVVMVDEAYYEISGVTAAGLIGELKNLAVTRTLSKAFGLAGVRLGYALAGPAISDALRRVRPPGSISVVSAALGVKALSDLGAMRDRVARVVSERERLKSRLRELGLDVRDSAANFLLVRPKSGAAAHLLKQGLVVRTFPPSSPLREYVRITVRTPPENDRLIQGIASLAAGKL
jgi:histidinol-phosphate aminotransferase